MTMRRPSSAPLFIVRSVVVAIAVPVAVVSMGALGASAQTATANAAGTTSMPTQQWSSRIVSSDELTTLPGSAASPTSTTRPAAAKKAKAKAAVTTSTVAGALTAPSPVAAQAFTADPGSDGSADPNADLWLALRKCESGNRYDLNTGNGYYGAYQFALSTWKKLGLAGYPHESPPAVQDEAARRLQAKSGWGVWPACSRRIGAR